MSRIMAIDYGDVRIGIALSDPLKIISSGYCTLNNNESILHEILKICLDKDVDSIIIGIPFDQNSQIGDSAKKVLNFTINLRDFLLKNKVEIVFYEQDERYTTFEAMDVMRTMKVKKKKKKKIIDQIAAAKILSDFLNQNSKIKINFDKYTVLLNN